MVAHFSLSGTCDSEGYYRLFWKLSRLPEVGLYKLPLEIKAVYAVGIVGVDALVSWFVGCRDRA